MQTPHYNSPHCTNRPHKQRGAALLILMLILIIGSSYLVLGKANINNRQAQDHEQTILALNTAKSALLAYAVTYPDRNASRGPGHLLCPDKDNDGDSDLSCSLLGTNPTTGWLPFETLELAELRDSSGNRLWYALSSQYRNFLSPPLNSTQPLVDNLFVDGLHGIVAVIIAAGAPLNDQQRGTSTNNATLSVQHYLEGSNKDLRTVNFVTTLGGNKRNDGEYDLNGELIFNDRIVFITQQELMSLVEQRVLGEVKQIFSGHQATASRYPWLSPIIEVPSASTFQAQDGIYRGHIPLLDSNGDTIAAPWFPIWFISNQWHHLITIHYATELPFPGGATSCTPTIDCLMLDNANNIRALAEINQQSQVLAETP